MSKFVSLVRALLALITFIVNTTCRWGLNMGVLFTVILCVHNVSQMSKEALKRRKEGKH